ncbi:ABC transporter permease [Pseudonocardia aurantiaca]|uniref:Transport permease protein n=1 Tax=Pseudonocardia aurantiaca TaxID=75290 RepID=A0ABW4FE00_9PSEU
MTAATLSHRAQRPSRRRVLGVEVTEGLLAIGREPTALFFSLLFPVMFFALFASLFGDVPGPDGIPTAVTMLATFGTFGVVSVMLLNPGIAVADDRTRGWLGVKKVSAVPVSSTIAGKVIAALPYALALLVALTAVSMLIVGPQITFGTWLRLMGVLLLGGLPFALFGLAVGFVASSKATTAILNAVLFPMVVASGLWFPFDMLPGFVRSIATLLPTYHLAQLALAQLTGAPALGHLLALLLTTAIGALLAGWAYRNQRQ